MKQVAQNSSRIKQCLSTIARSGVGRPDRWPRPLEPACGTRPFCRRFHATAKRALVKPYLLADIGEGITECQIIQWFVQPGARVAQFDKICEVQSDKASVEITSRYDGVIKRLYYEADDMAKVGKPLVDIDVQGSMNSEAEDLQNEEGQESGYAASTGLESGHAHGTNSQSVDCGQSGGTVQAPKAVVEFSMARQTAQQSGQAALEGAHSTLATPAVRHLTKQLNIDITDVVGSGKDGRVLKEDIQRYASSRPTRADPSATSSLSDPDFTAGTEETKPRPLTPIQSQMFRTMTRSLAIPHFLYTDTVNLSDLTTLRHKVNRGAESSSAATGYSSASISPVTLVPKLSALPFILKAVSLSLRTFPLLNSCLDLSDPSKPTLLSSPRHNIGLAIDTPSGLLVPVIRRVEQLSIASIASEIARLSALARAGRLSAADLSGATFTVSNIGSIGGTAVAPVIVPPQVAILGVGRARVVPGFGPDGQVVRREECVFSWSADHRVVDGALVARCAQHVRGLLEDVGGMLVRLR